MLSALLLAVLPFALAKPTSTIPSASKFAGSAVTDPWPPAGATFTSSNTYFPDASEVGFGGATPS